MVIEIIIFIVFLVLVVPQIVHWMNVFAKGYVKKKNKVILDQYRKAIMQNIHQPKMGDMKKISEDDMRGYV